jgi:hypothetical protein
MTDADWEDGVTARKAQYEMIPTAMSTTIKLDASSPPECAVGVGWSGAPSPVSDGAAASLSSAYSSNRATRMVQKGSRECTHHCTHTVFSSEIAVWDRRDHVQK